jgi:predicted MFS family arabinose efflux permease
MLTFVAAQSVEWLYAARILQGVATGIASGAISAWLLDLQPPGDRRLGGLVNCIALMGGLALGAGLLAQYAPDPLHLVFWLLLVSYVVALAAMPLIPDPVSRLPGWRKSLRPRIGVPTVARPMFSATAPSLVAIWAVAGLYLSLGASLATSLLHTENHVAGGLVIVALLGAGAVASLAASGAEPGVLIVRGSVVLIAGLAVTLLAVALGSSIALYVGSLVAGIGLGPAFSGIFRSLAPLAPPDRRAALLAAIYVVVYLSFSIPAILAGITVTRIGLQTTALAFGVVAMVLAGMTTIALSRRPAPLEEPAT